MRRNHLDKTERKRYDSWEQLLLMGWTERDSERQKGETENEGKNSENEMVRKNWFRCGVGGGGGGGGGGSNRKRRRVMF
jgi:hypothetical protein